MDRNIGRALKTIATVICIIGLIGTIIGFFVYLSMNIYSMAFIILGAGLIGTWLSFAVLYGLGELVDNSIIIKNKLILSDEEFKKWYTSGDNHDIKENNHEQNVSELPKEIKEQVEEKNIENEKTEELVDESKLNDYYPTIKNIPDEKKEKKYQKAKDYIDGALLEFGIDILASLGDYKDSKILLDKACKRAKKEFHLRVIFNDTKN